MLQIIGTVDDGFAIFASPCGHESYSVAIFPERPEAGAEIQVPAQNLKDFASRHRGVVQQAGTRESQDLFIHSLTEDDIFQLIAPVGRPRHKQAHAA